MLPLHIEIDYFDRTSWDQLITHFDDASLFQTWSYGVASRGSVSNIVIKAGEEILGCCLVNLWRLPFFNICIADIKWGPLCMRKGRLFEPAVLDYLMRGIKEEYAIKRGYLLRIWPHATGERKELLEKILEREGFRRNVLQRPYRSLRIDLSPSIDDLRNNIAKDWRRGLRRAEENGLNLIEGTNIELFNTLRGLAKEVEKIKKFSDLTNYELYRHTQEDLPDPLKIRLVVCEAQGEPVCAAGYSVIGDTGFYVLAGTGEKAYGLYATYLVQWTMIQRLKESGVRYFDLGPFNPERNPGVYHFKKEIAGKHGWEEKFLGEFEGSFNLRGRIAKILLDCSKFLRGICKKRNH